MYSEQHSCLSARCNSVTNITSVVEHFGFLSYSVCQCLCLQINLALDVHPPKHPPSIHSNGTQAKLLQADLAIICTFIVCIFDKEISLGQGLNDTRVHSKVFCSNRVMKLCVLKLCDFQVI